VKKSLGGSRELIGREQLIVIWASLLGDFSISPSAPFRWALLRPNKNFQIKTQLDEWEGIDAVPTRRLLFADLKYKKRRILVRIKTCSIL